MKLIDLYEAIIYEIQRLVVLLKKINEVVIQIIIIWVHHLDYDHDLTLIEILLSLMKVRNLLMLTFKNSLIPRRGSKNQP